MPLLPIASPSDPCIADYLGVRDAELQRTRFDAPGGLFIAEGELVVRRLLASPYRTRSVLLTHTRLRTVQDAVDRLPPETPVYLVDQDVMNSIVGFNIHRGVLALGVRAPDPDLSRLLDDAAIVVVLEDLANHDNIGAIFRNVAALAGLPPHGGAVLLSPRSSDPLYRKSIRVSMGWVLGVPFARLTPWPDSLRLLREAGYTTLALHPHPEARGIAEAVAEAAPLNRKIALLVGTEGPGLTPGALASADSLIRIPMRGQAIGRGPAAGVDSLNVGVAVAIALHRFAELLAPPFSPPFPPPSHSPAPPP